MADLKDMRNMGDDYEGTRKCEICEHYKPDERGIYSCEIWECDFKELRELGDE